jgi:hypothetical protein
MLNEVMKIKHVVHMVYILININEKKRKKLYGFIKYFVTKIFKF